MTDPHAPILHPDERVLRRIPFEDLRFSDKGEFEFVDEDLRTVTRLATAEGEFLDPEPEIRYLIHQLSRVAPEKKEFLFTHDGIRYRTATTHAQTAIWYSLRRIQQTVRELEDFDGIAPLYDQVLEVGRRQGLILATGATGTGKSSLLGALMVSYAKIYGAFGITMEDPVELPLEGLYEDTEQGLRGRILQQAMPEEQFAIGLKDALRKRPRMIQMGELRTPAAATAAAEAGITGHLVLTTIHGATPTQAVLNLVSKIAASGNTDHAWKTVAECLQMVICMKRDMEHPRPYAEIFTMTGVTSEEGTRAKIRAGNIENLQDDIEAILARSRSGMR